MFLSSHLETMKKKSAKLIMYRRPGGELEVLLVHPGGPFWKNRDAGAWSIPKGEIEEGESALDAARREFEEELGTKARGPFLPLGRVKQKSGKVVQAWAFCGNCDPVVIRSNFTKIEWPPKSSNELEIPEVDRVEFFPIADAIQKSMQHRFHF